MATLTNITRVVEADQEAAAGRAYRSNNLGMFLVERWQIATWAKGDVTKGQWNLISSHVSMEEAQKAKAKLDKKLSRAK